MPKTLYTWQEAAQHLCGLIDKVRPLQGDNVTLEETDKGVRVSAKAVAASDAATAAVYLYKITGGAGGAYTVELYNERTDDASKKIGTGTLMFTMKHISDNLKTDGTIWGVCNAKQCSVLNITPA